MSPTLRATLTLSGTIIGLGTFAIPWAFWQAGFWVGVAELAILAALVTFFHLIYGEIVLRTPGVKTRLYGYIQLYLGSSAARFSLAALLISLWGVLLVYTVVGGSFLSHLHPILARGEVGPLLFFLLGVGGVLTGLRGVSRLEAWGAVVLVAIILVIVGATLPHLKTEGLTALSLSALLVPYGILLFALDGSASIPGLEEILGPARRRQLRRVIIGGTLLPAALYFLFALGVVGAVGGGVSPDGISGLNSILSPQLLWLAYAFGFLAIVTTFWILATYLWETLTNDLDIPKRLALSATFAPPLILYLVGIREFTALVSLIGAFFFPINAILLLFAHNKAKAFGKEPSPYSLPNSALIRMLFTILFVGGFVYELWYFFLATP